ncbi:uncharacterized protein LOC126656730 [Mercurialis annua]|uniref:uncharacterized protein LOC126656730 n=1 Tax=Mercurialis annua TaxID=3986 RepID=UPI002160E83B|nr:uncharacterized protein LOC126656730 [Mercurialis annua]
MRQWNKCAVIRHVWDLLVMKESLWATWITKNKLKKLSFWGITKPLDTSWNWRNLIKLRQSIKDCFSYKLGKGNCSFWFDPWLCGKAICDEYPVISLEDVDIPKIACMMRKMMKFLESSVNLGSSQSILLGITSELNILRCLGGKLFGGSGCIPKHSFIAWLAIKKSLKTRDKLKRWGCIDNENCVFCNNAPESVEHLFFECPELNAVIKAVMEACLINRDWISWRREWSWYGKKTNGKTMLAKIIRLAFMSSIYNVWRGRNCIIFEKEKITGTVIKSWIRNDILLKMFSRRNNSEMFLKLYQNWIRLV